MSDPPRSDIDFKNKMALALSTLNNRKFWTKNWGQTLMELILACWSWTWNGIFHSSQGNFNAWRRSYWYFNWKCTDNEERPERTIEASSSSRWNPLTSGIGSTGSQTGSDFWLTTLPEPSLTVTKTESRSSKSEDYPQPRFSLPLSIRPKILYGPSKKTFKSSKIFDSAWYLF